MLYYLPGFYAGLSPALVGITPYMGLNFALYESVKSFSESSFFQLNSKYQNSITDIGGKNEIPKVEGTLASVLRKGLCGAVAGGTSKFIVYPLVCTFVCLTTAHTIFYILVHYRNHPEGET